MLFLLDILVISRILFTIFTYLIVIVNNIYYLQKLLCNIVSEKSFLFRL